MRNKEALSRIAAALALTAMASGCGSKTVDIGDDREPAVLGASLSDYEGSWTGYAELAEWSDGTDTVRLILDDNGNGVLEVGDADELPPPVADEGYPPGPLDSDARPMLGFEPVNGVISGFSYPIANAVVESKRIRLSSSSGELFSEWCALQTPSIAVGTFPETYTCLGSSGYSVSEEGCFIGPQSDIPVNCGQLACISECTCDADACTSARSNDDIRLDAALDNDGEELEGSLDTPQGRFQVRMTRE